MAQPPRTGSHGDDVLSTDVVTMQPRQAAAGRRTPARAVDHLFLVLEGARPLAGGARWSLEGVDEVRIRRGSTRGVVREHDGGRQVLSIKLPDGLLSSRHGRLMRGPAGWTLVDDGSTNGTLVDGVRIDARALADGDAFEMGAAQFVLRVGLPTPVDSPVDLESARLVGAAHGVGSLLPAYAEELADLGRIALSGLSVLLLGESGAGKEVLATAAHRLSGRSGPLVPVNCGALTATLMESQLFGHTKGAFSGAVSDELGFIRASDGGTLFLDEIGDLPAGSQAALLRVLETRQVVAVGSTRAIPVDLRVIAATLKSADSLRPDLRARVAGFTHTLLPLRERIEDLGLILAELLRRAAGDRAAALKLAPEAGRALLAHDWPLNVRELRQALDVALALARDTTLTLPDLPASVRGDDDDDRDDDRDDPVGDALGGDAPASSRPAAAAGSVRRPRPAVAEEGAARPAASAAPAAHIPEDDAGLRALVLASLEQHRGNISEISRALGKTRMQIHRWMRRFDIDPTRFRS